MRYVFSAPGRTEISGNHTDHQHGRVLAAAVDLKTTADVTLNGTDEIRVCSEGYAPVKVDIKNLEKRPDEINTLLEQCGSQPIRQSVKLYDLLLRPQLVTQQLAQHLPDLAQRIGELEADLRHEIVEAAEIGVKYGGYIQRERMVADKMHRLEDVKIKGRFDYSTIQQISTEGRQKLTAIDPETIGQASRIPGISPSDINILLLLLGR